MLKFYRILTYLLLPAGLLLGLMALIGLLVSLGNFAALLPVFMVGATVIYIFASFLFLNRVIDGHRTVKLSLRDWIRVNAFVALFFAVSSITQSLAFMNNPQLINEAMDQAMAMQKMAIPKELMLQTMKVLFYAMLSLGILLAVHVTISLRLLKQYRDWFV